MDFTKIKVLLTDGGARQTLTLLHGLKELGCYVGVLCTTKLDICHVSKLPDEKILDPRVAADGEEYISFLIETITEKGYDILLPVAEMTTDKITKHEEELKKHVKLACAPRESYLNAFDKQRTFELAAQTNIPRPLTRRDGQSVEEYLRTVSFPLIIKPRNGVGSIGFHKFESESDFWSYIAEKNINLDDYVLQEFVHYKDRLGVVVFMDQHGKACMAYADEILRWYPIDAGTATAIRSIDNPEMIQHAVRLLQAMNWHGVAALSYMVDVETGEPKLCEINGRIPASIKLSWQLGYNVAGLLVQMACDENIEPYPANTKAGVTTRHFQADMLWFLKSPDRFRCKPSWFSWKNARDVVLWKGDIKPWFAYTFRKVLTFRESMNKRRH